MGFAHEKAAPGYQLTYNRHRRTWSIREQASKRQKLFHGDGAKQRAIAFSVELVRSGRTLADVEDE